MTLNLKDINFFFSLRSVSLKIKKKIQVKIYHGNIKHFVVFAISYTEKMKHAGYLYIYNHYIKVQT